MKAISLTQGYSAIIDDEDYDKLMQYKWCYNLGYASRSLKKENKKITIFMHRVVLDTPENMYTDHISGNELDNRRGNLRIGTKSQNMANSRIRVNNTSGYKGVHWHKLLSKWRAVIWYLGKPIHIGLFLTKEEAAKAYNNKAIEVHKEFARLNVIDV